MNDSLGLDEVTVSRALSHALRHEPWLYELELDDEGWTSVDVLIGALRRIGAPWHRLGRGDLERAIDNAERKAHQLEGDRIRALSGQVAPGRLRRESKPPLDKLYHGTSAASARVFLREGLRPIDRRYVHLSADEELARQVGWRKDRHPVVLVVAAAEAYRAGVRFYAGHERVWLAERVDVEFLSVSR